MTEIWNLNTLCRCCHSDGCFKSLNQPYQSKNGVEVYEIILQETLAIRISPPPVDASYNICDECIERLKDASQFREQILACERKFKIYCTNEQFFNSPEESVKVEVESNAEDNDDQKLYYDDDQVQTSDNNFEENRNADIGTVKEEITVEVDIKHPIEKVEQLEAVTLTPNESIKTEAEQSEDIKKIGNLKKSIPQKKTVGQIENDTLDKRKKLRMRRKILQSFIVQVKTAKGITFSCKSCEGSYKTRKDLLKHISLQHHKQYKCDKCGKLFNHSCHLKRHAKSHLEHTYICRYCNKKFMNKANLNIHENIHTKQLVYQCDICQKELRYKTTLRKHILQMHSTETKKVLCDICGWSFKQRSNLEAHIRVVHLKQRPFSCSICGKTYTAKKHVKNHMKTAHSGNPKPYQCDLCSKQFACPKYFKLHRLTHDNHFECRYCPTVFDNKKDCDIHAKMHTQKLTLNSPYGCHLCGKVLMTKFTLNRHIELHDGIKKFTCDICGVKFTQKCLLVRHNRRKHDPNVKTEKTKCDLCKKLVKDIEKHMETHDSDKRKYFCDICGKNYSENNALTRHKNQKHFGVSYDCDVCGKKYMKKKSLETHKFKIHKIKTEVVDHTAPSEDMEMTSMT